MIGVTAASLPACARCGKSADTLFPREPVGDVCSGCYESLGRLRPEWSRLEVLGVVGLLLGSALLVIALLALLLR